MATKQDSTSTPDNRYDNFIKELLAKVREYSNPDELNALRTAFRKNIPLSMRSYVAGYLIKQMAGNVKPDSFLTLFVGIGKNRRVYPKDIAGYFAKAAFLSRNEIGSIKVMENYSFVDVAADRAQNVIDILDGKEYRGRKLTVNFARKRDIGDDNTSGQVI